MRKISLLFLLLMVLAISGCATEQGGSGGGYERPSGHQGHHH